MLTNDTLYYLGTFVEQFTERSGQGERTVREVYIAYSQKMCLLKELFANFK